jgi:hypothetical protein
VGFRPWGGLEGWKNKTKVTKNEKKETIKKKKRVTKKKFLNYMKR